MNVDLVEAIKPLAKAHSEWKGVVSDASYRVLFEEATERPGSSPLDKNYADGTYICAACHLPLFDSSQDCGFGDFMKYDPLGFFRIQSEYLT